MPRQSRRYTAEELQALIQSEIKAPDVRRDPLAANPDPAPKPSAPEWSDFGE